MFPENALSPMVEQTIFHNFLNPKATSFSVLENVNALQIAYLVNLTKPSFA
jgi:hypothetical protein